MSNTKLKNTKRKKWTDDLTHEAMRQKISFTKTLNDINENEVWLQEKKESGEKLDSTQISAMKILIDSKWRKLDKLLPALKAIEHTGKGGGAVSVEHVIKFGDDE